MRGLDVNDLMISIIESITQAKNEIVAIISNGVQNNVP